MDDVYIGEGDLAGKGGYRNAVVSYLINGKLAILTLKREAGNWRVLDRTTSTRIY